MKAENIKIGIVQTGATADINSTVYDIWHGYVTYNDKPFMELSGLKALTPRTFKDGSVAPESIMLSDAGNKDIQIGTVQIKTGVSSKNDKEYSIYKSNKIELLDLVFPVSGFFNADKDSVCLKYDSNTADYLTNPDLGGKWYLENDKPLPYFIAESDECLSESEMKQLTDALTPDFAGFEDWWIANFPASSATKEFAESKKASSKRDELIAQIRAKRDKSATLSGVPF